MPALEKEHTKYSAALLEQAGYVPILQVLSHVEKATQFTQCFKHHSIKHAKQRPDTEVYFAGLMELGCNIGVRKMAQISLGMRESTLVNAVNWYFNLKNLQAANQRIKGARQISADMQYKPRIFILKDIKCKY